MDPAIVRMNNTPAFVRHYWRALDEALNGFFSAASVTPFLADRYAVFQRNGNGAVSPFVPSGLGDPVLSVTDWITQRRNFILGELAAVDAEFAVDGPDWIVTSQNQVTLTGSAPVRAKTLAINAMPYAVSWDTVTSWSMDVPVSSGTNVLTVAALDGEGIALPGAFRTITVECTGSGSAPEDFVVINEWMADNSGSVLDPADQDSDDWFELYNSGNEYADLSGFGLTDDPSQPAKFIIPAGVGVGPQGFLLVWADEESSQTVTNGDLHVNFKLSASGEVIKLRTPNGELLDSLVFGAQVADVSEGRFPDGAASPFFDMPDFSPGAPNRLWDEPVLGSLVVDLDNGFATVVWASIPGATYRVQYKNNLDDPAWTDLPGDVVATGTTAMKTDATVPGIAQRFYRVERD